MMEIVRHGEVKRRATPSKPRWAPSLSTFQAGAGLMNTALVHWLKRSEKLPAPGSPQPTCPLFAEPRLSTPQLPERVAGGSLEPDHKVQHSKAEGN